MRIGTFVMGGLAGAAIVMMIQRNSKMSAVTANMGQSMRNRMNDMISQQSGKALNSLASNLADSSAKSKHTDNASHKYTNGLSQVSQLASQDPEVSNQINEILNQNGQNSI